MSEELDIKYELAIDRVFETARELASVACAGLREQEFITDETLCALELYLSIALTESDKSDVSKKYRLAATATRNNGNSIVSQAYAIKAGKRTAVRSLQLARRIVLKQDFRQSLNDQ
ncbi:hypothetical protein H7X69_03340 [Candidatus Saccharibacteria bacterium]|nr:hypothetical protein [Candidatus Saccharibacteria bacterium]